MSETPNNPAGHMTERIMFAIRDHLKPNSSGAGGEHHYNRAYEKVYALLSEIPVASTEAIKGIQQLCGHIFYRRGSFHKCERPHGHSGTHKASEAAIRP